jgi:chaperone BCS1
VALAGKYSLQVYSLSLSVSWMNDDILLHLFSRLPRSCIVLLEDVDACGVTREGDRAGATTASATTPSKPDDAASADAKAAAKVTFSGLLNAIDGVASKEGRLLIMTTNHRSRLDEALIRPGRVDIQVRFDYADAGIVHDLFRALYDVSDEDKALLKFPADFPAADELAQLARAFADRVPPGRFSPAEVQGLLLRFKKHPRLAVAAVRDWVVGYEIEKLEKERREALRQQCENMDDTQKKLAAVRELLEMGVVTQGAVAKSLATSTDADTTATTANAHGEDENPATITHSLQNGSATDNEPKKPLANGIKGAKTTDDTTLTNGSSTANGTSEHRSRESPPVENATAANGSLSLT